MKTLLKILLVSIPVLMSCCDGCDDDSDHIAPPPKGFSVGKIYGYDMTDCGCCGGYIVKIKNRDYKFFDDDVSGSNPLTGMDIQYPLYVYLKWTIKSEECQDRILVQELQLATVRK